MLKKKMLRDIKKNISQYITIFLMILIGLFAYTGIESYMLGMKKSAQKYYEEYNLEDFNAYGEFSNKDIEKVKKIYNVKSVNGKLTLPSLGIIGENNDKVRINFINENTVSKFYIVDGVEFDSNNDGVWLDYYYAKENNIKPGETVKVIYENYTIKRKVAGLIEVPDLVYYVKDETELFPNHKNFGYIYMSINFMPKELIEDTLINKGIFTKEYFDKGVPVIYQDYISYNNLMVDVNKEKNIDNVKTRIKEKVDVLALLDIKDSLSYKTYQSEIDEGHAYVGVFSGLFIFIALLSVITTESRMVRKERKEIGILKSLGYSDSKIIRHYLSYIFYISIVAIILGIIFGYFILGKIFINMEMQYYVVPNYRAVIPNSSYLVGIYVLLGLIIVAYLSIRKILKKSPADTLQLEKPTVKKNSLNFTKIPLFKFLSFSTKWNMRDIVRNKIRVFMGIAGMLGCIVLIIIALGMNDTIKNYLKIEFETINSYKNKINLNEEIDLETANTLIKSYGNSTSLSIQVDIYDTDNIVSSNIFVNDTNGLVNILDKNNQKIEIEKDGIYITRNLAKKLNKRIGDTITWKPYGTNKYYESNIIGFNVDPQNQNITTSKEYYESKELRYIPDTIYTNDDVQDTNDIVGISSVQSIDDVSGGVNLMLSTLISMVYLIIFFACILGIIIIYNIGTLSYIEKNYQFATLKVLGFSNIKITHIFIKQNIWIALISLLIGIPLGTYTLSYIFKNALSIDYDFNAYITNETYIITCIITLVLTLFVSIFLSRKIKRIDMVTSLKSNE